MGTDTIVEKQTKTTTKNSNKLEGFGKKRGIKT